VFVADPTSSSPTSVVEPDVGKVSSAVKLLPAGTKDTFPSVVILVATDSDRLSRAADSISKSPPGSPVTGR
jgi:hypothetical protein